MSIFLNESKGRNDTRFKTLKKNMAYYGRDNDETNEKYNKLSSRLQKRYDPKYAWNSREEMEGNPSAYERMTKKDRNSFVKAINKSNKHSYPYYKRDKYDEKAGKILDKYDESVEDMFNEAADYVIGCLNEEYEIDTELLRESAEFILDCLEEE